MPVPPAAPDPGPRPLCSADAARSPVRVCIECPEVTAYNHALADYHAELTEWCERQQDNGHDLEAVTRRRREAGRRSACWGRI